MKKKIKFFCCFVLLLVLSIPIFSQGPGEPFHPMTAPGSRHINRVNTQYFAHKLFWKNPSNTTYNDIYLSPDSSLVISLDSRALVLSGYDSSRIFNDLSLILIGTLEHHTKYYWRVVEHNGSCLTIGPIWYFISEGYRFNYWSDDFSNGLSNYTVNPPGGYWGISYSSNAGGTIPELEHNNLMSGTSYLILNDFFDLSPNINPLSFRYSFDYWFGAGLIGLAYSLDEGITWIPFWQQVVNENIPPTLVSTESVPNENYVKLSLFSSNIYGYWYVDDLILDSPLTVPAPPGQIQVLADTSTRRVFLNWSPGFGIDPIAGYKIQRKIGLPNSSSAYQTISEVGPYTLSFEDSTVQLNAIYTYRIQTKLGWGGVTTWSNEATAYVPDIPTSVKTKTELASEFSLEQNYPNPFNPTTKIKYSIPTVTLRQAQSDILVTLKVYDVLGKEVATLVNEERQQGTYEIEFNGTGLPSGIYFYQLKGADPESSSGQGFVETKKMLLLK